MIGNEVDRIAIWLWKADETFFHWASWRLVSDVRKSAYRRMARALIAEGFNPSV